MSRDASISNYWGDSEYVFRLPIGQMRELQEKCDAGPQFLLSRVSSGEWRVDDLRETLRLGLIGGGLKPDKALTLVRRYFDPFPYADHVLQVQMILGAAVFGVAEEDGGKKAGVETTAPTSPSPEASSDSPPSMDQAP